MQLIEIFEEHRKKLMASECHSRESGNPEDKQDITSSLHGAPRASLWSPKTIPTYAKASVGHPPVSKIRRSMVDPSLKGFPSGVTHSSTAKAVVSCVGG